ncbi:HAMP domain-containing protein [Seongchinamella sediminis]|uniref:histidine kinase n=1 Tax=Seongchinamella sediminis TaxID=2283635 RepID=A0A3L7E3Z0_9GAMM|nr:ATP-binding protein [Seongchinamella sediminis]RLQ23082.1 HAMP domain-containing protein [Seongchinamella sediminis]
MRSLYTKLSVALLLIMLTVGGGFYAVEKWSTRQYHEELTQRLNASIAMYVTDQTTLIENGEVNRAELARLADRAMVINPSVEVYLLDPEGRILGHALPPESILTDRVDLAPVLRLIGGAGEPPLYGADPRNPHREKVFSASPVTNGDSVEGYLYVVLGGQQYDQLAGRIRGSYARKTSLGAIAALVVGGVIAGLLVFSLLTRRLSHLTQAVQTFSDSGFDTTLEPRQFPESGGEDRGGDEISRLNQAFAAMAHKIHEQFNALQETDRLRRELISNVSHDLRTPLATMHGYVDTLLLKNDELDATEREHYLQITRKHTQRLGALIGDLFELSKLESGSMPLSLETFSLAELLNDVVQDFELEARRRHVELKLQGEPGSALVHADIALVQRVLENLIRNALDSTPAGGSITLGISTLPESVAVAVSDTGCGIPEDRIDSIFNRFYSSRHGQTSGGDSTGLGLAIVKRILDLHGSRITVSSTMNVGTRFEFSLPIPRAA